MARQGAAAAGQELSFSDREVANWSGFHQAIDYFLDGKHIFRGDCDVRHQLVPSVGRNSENWTYTPELELELLEELDLSRLRRAPKRFRER